MMSFEEASAITQKRLQEETDSMGELLTRLEFDIGLPPGDSPPNPGIFLRPSERPIVGDGAGQRIRDISVGLDSLVYAAGWAPDAAERRQVERLHRAQDAA